MSDNENYSELPTPRYDDQPVTDSAPETFTKADAEAAAMERAHERGASTELAVAEIGGEIFTEIEFSKTDLRKIETFEDALALIAEKGGVVLDATKIRLGFEKAVKEKLVNIPFIILEFSRVGSSDYSAGGGRYVWVRGITKTGEKFVFTDGSQGGICDQLWEMGDALNLAGGDEEKDQFQFPILVDGLRSKTIPAKKDKEGNVIMVPDGKGGEKPLRDTYVKYHLDLN